MRRRSSALVVLALLATPAAADTRLGAGYMMGRPIAGSVGGADHAAVLHAEHAIQPELDLGVIVELGHSPGNADESLTRLAVLPTLGVRSGTGELVARLDVALGWQLADGRTELAGIPVSGTEARGLRAEIALGIEAAISTRAALRARAGLALDGIYPASIDGATKLGPLVELGLAIRL